MPDFFFFVKRILAILQVFLFWAKQKTPKRGFFARRPGFRLKMARLRKCP
jgi:hypothetical protein